VNVKKRSAWTVAGFLFVLGVGGGLLAACPGDTIVCSTGLERCGLGCADFRSDERNCGACGVSCQVGSLCQDSQCVCRDGSTTCGGVCVSTASNALHCGGCGIACGPGQVCEQGSCKAGCTLGTSTQCGQSCVDLQRDPGHCGECNRGCPGAQACHAGRCSFDVVLACRTTGQLVGVNAASMAVGPAVPLGAGPEALAVMDGVVLSADSADKRLYQAELPALGTLPEHDALGSGSNHVLVEGRYVYVANALSHSVQIFERTTPDASVGTGLGLTQVQEITFPANATPQAVAKIGSSLFVTLYGGFDQASWSAGQKVVRVDITNLAAPLHAEVFNLSSVDLKSFDGGTALARPQPIIAHQNELYVGLNNFDPGYQPAGPGVVARINPDGGTITPIYLGAECQQVYGLASSGNAVVASCAGKISYDSTFTAVGSEAAGVALIIDNHRAAFWSAACPDGASACRVPAPGRLAAVGNRVFVGDLLGRVFVLDVSSGQLVPRRAFFSDGGTPLRPCPLLPDGGTSNVSDLAGVP
jgi:hypothetical protein